ncbi:enoyl-CoA hydratase-related protein [Sporichthya sp.]|uniref:enoyl-CoA hydratase/isomerase family protein n=1 Tax=Sporichthya sp. TaxID=65475 RepID=UPI00182F99D6|nr:enoyl-CoA hydratase-related protein [Sporichthya sp.]MBA3741465.1 enoyl-CoA hydratase/isomerase family protein [Sporichthya sp.]
MTEEQPPVRVDHDGPVAVVTLDRPERLNALSHDLLRELRTQVAVLDERRDVRAIVLTGAGRAFSAGADLQGGPSDAEDVLRRLYNPLIRDLMGLQKPLVAAVNGVAAGAGVSLALACDLRVAAATATFRLAFVNVGLVPDAGATWLLPRIVGTARASEMALLGRAVQAEEALAWGLVNRVVPDGETLGQALELAHAVAALSSSVGAIRRLLHESADRTLEEQLDAEATTQGLAQYGPDYAEARQAFKEKRKPRFARD